MPKKGPQTVDELRMYWRPVPVEFLSSWEKFVESLTGWTRMGKVKVRAGYSDIFLGEYYWDHDIKRAGKRTR